MASHTSSPSLTGPPGGWKLFRWPLPRLWHALRPCSWFGSRGSVCRPLSLQTGAHSFLVLFGLLCVCSAEDVTPVQPLRRGRPPLCQTVPVKLCQPVPVPVPPPSIPMGRGSSKEQSRPLAPSIPVPVPPPSIPMGRGSSKVQVRPLAPSKQRTYKDMLLRNLK